MGADLAGPGSGARDHLGGVKCGLDGGDARRASVRYGDGCDFVAGGEVHPSILGGLPRSGGEGSRVYAALLEIESWATRKSSLGERGFGFGQVDRKESGSGMPNMFGRRKKNGPEVAQVDFCPGFDFQFVREFRIHAGAGPGEWPERGRRFHRTVDEHSSRGVGGFAAGFSALDDQDGGAALPQGDRQREADDATADDYYIPSLHVGIVEELRARGHGDGTKMTGNARVHRMTCMKKIFVTGVVLAMLGLPGTAFGQKDKDEEPTAWLYFVVVKDDNGKPVRNAAVIMHPVNPKGKQSRGGMELKTDVDGKANFDGAPLGMLRVQVLASGFQTFGEDYDVEKPKMEITIKLKRPLGQFTVYDDRAKDPNAAPKQDAPPPAPDKKPN